MIIESVERILRSVRRRLSASEWGAVVLRLPRTEGEAHEPGILMVQIDGLSHAELLRALERREMPFLRRLIEREDYRASRVYSGMPSTTPAFQGELFYGAPLAVPAFSFVDRARGRLVRMYEREPVSHVEQGLKQAPGLLAEGSAYCDIYDGGASDPRFCMASLGWSDFVRTARPLSLPLLGLLNAFHLLRAAWLVAREIPLALAGCVQGIRRGFDARMERKHVWTRVGICVLLREMIVLGAKVDLARGVPAVHVNLVGYDERAHRRGPSSRFAHADLRETDAAIARLARAAWRSARREYDVWVHSDHGQEATRPYVALHGRSVQEAVGEVFRAHGLGGGAAEDDEAETRRRRLLSEILLTKLLPGAERGERWVGREELVVAAMGPLGHVYAPGALANETRDRIARDLVERAHVPLVLAAVSDEEARAWTARGAFSLPRDVEEILGPGHPHAELVARDLVALCRHPNAGDLVLSGWRRDGVPLSFPRENGAHAGPGPEETSAFVVAPADTPLPAPPGRTLRPADLRQAALAVLGRESSAIRRWRLRSRDGPQETLRVMTYNVHSCVGMDGRISPRRIARVIAQADPDVVALQELDLGRARTGGVDQAAEIARELEMHFHFHPTLSVEEERYGDAILSRHPMKLVRARPLPGLPGREPRGALWVEILVEGRRLQVIDTHLGLSPRERRLQARALVGPDWLGHPACAPWRILCGDLNSFPRSPTCRALGSALRDCQASPKRRARGTWFGRRPLWRIDYVFLEPELEVVSVDVPSTSLTRVASDHLPLVAEIRLPEPAASPTRETGYNDRLPR